MAPSLFQSCLAAETRSAADAYHPLLTGLPPLAVLGLALVAALAPLAWFDPGLEQG
ncbi:hypothetical protein D3C72_2510390 [compost metagenome]